MAQTTARQYSQTDKENLLGKVAEFDGSTEKAARATGVPRRTLQGWWERLTADEKYAYLQAAKDRQEAWWQALHDECLKVAKNKVKDLTARDALVGAGIAFDKLALLRGQATNIEATISSDAEALARAVEDVLGKVTVESNRAAADKKGSAHQD